MVTVACLAGRVRPDDRSPFTIYHSLTFGLLVARVARHPKLRGGVGWERVGFVVGREGAGAHVFGVGLYGLVDGFAHVRVLPYEARARLAEGEAEEVVRDQYLRVAVGARADAYRGDVKRLGHGARYLARDDFEDDREDARLFERQRVFDERARRVGSLRLKSVAPDFI